MTNETPVKDEVFPKDTNKSYAIVEVVRGDSPMVGKGPDDTVFSFPVVLLWEILLLLGVTLVIFLLSLLKQAPLDEIANPQITTDPAKAPWYFVGLQELLEHMYPTLAGIIIPGVLVGFLMSIPYLDNSREFAGVWFSTKRGKLITLWTAVYTFIAMVGFIAFDNAVSIRESLRGVTEPWVAQWLIPGLILTVIVLLPVLILWRKKGSSRDIMIALFTVMIVSAVVMTISGFLFRGPGFEMYLPWQMPDGYNPWDDF